MPATGPVNHIFVDFENVHTVDLTGFGAHLVKVTLLLGEKHKRLETDLVEQLLEHAEHVQLVRLTQSGRNALDFTLTYYLGRTVYADPTGIFHVVSKDKGFDPLIEHLKRQHVKTYRHDLFSAAVAQINGNSTTEAADGDMLPVTTNPTSDSPTRKTAVPSRDPSMGEVVLLLKRDRAHQPKRRTALHALLKNHFRVTDSRVREFIAELEESHISIDAKGRVTYTFAPDS
jgi:hypothetical protein